jgi:hypothetical protein
MIKNHATDEELILIRNHIIYPMLLDAVQNNLSEIELSTMTLKPLYAKATEVIMKLIHKDMIDTKQVLKKANIKVFDRDLSKQPLFEYEYIVRGYSYRFSMRREKIRSEMSVMLPSYMNKVLRMMTDS